MRFIIYVHVVRNSEHEVHVLQQPLLPYAPPLARTMSVKYLGNCPRLLAQRCCCTRFFFFLLVEQDLGVKV